MVFWYECRYNHLLVLIRFLVSPACVSSLQPLTFLHERCCYGVVYLGYGIDLSCIRCSCMSAVAIVLFTLGMVLIYLGYDVPALVCERMLWEPGPARVVGRPQGLWPLYAGRGSRSWRLQQRWLSSRPKTGSRSRPSGRSTLLPHGTSLDFATPNEVHQADMLFLPHDSVGLKTFHYAFTVVDIASRYKEAEPLTSKTAEVANALSLIYRWPLKWPKLHQVDLGCEFMGAVSQLLASTGSRSAAFLWTSTRTRALWSAGTGRCLSGCLDTSMLRRCTSLQVKCQQSVARLPGIISALNREVMWLTGKKPREAIKAGRVAQKSSSTVPGRLVGLHEQKLPFGVGVHYLYQPGELKGGPRHATDPVWSLEVYWLGHSVTKPDEPVLYYLQDGPPRGFVREELLVVPPDTQQMPDGVLTK